MNNMDEEFSSAASRVEEYISEELSKLENRFGEPPMYTHSERVAMILNVTRRHLGTLHRTKEVNT